MKISRPILLGTVLACLAATSAGCGAPAANQVAVAAASDLRYALEPIIAAVEADNPDYDIAVTYGSSGQFVQQIDNGAPFDLYLSADIAYPRELIAQGHGSTDDLFAYALGRLVLWVPTGSPLDPTQGLDVLLAADRVAIANPQHAPYGQAAVAALTSAGIYDEIQPHLVLGENVAQAMEFVTSGNADVGIVALSLALSEPLQGRGTWWEVPQSAFPRLEQGGLVLTDSPGAQALREALVGAEGRQTLARFGFGLPED